MKDDSRLDWVLNPNRSPYIFNSIKVKEIVVREYFLKHTKEKPNCSKEDFLWSLLQFLIIETSKTSNNLEEMYQQHSSIYFLMAVFRRTYEDVKANDLMQLSLDSNLRSYLSNEITGFKMGVSVITVNNCCEYCNSKNGKCLDVRETLESKLYDAEKCTNERGCRTTYAQVPITDKNGRLIRIEKEPIKQNKIEENKGCLGFLFQLI